MLTSGGMGMIYRGEHLRLRVPVAIKVLRRDLDERDRLVQKLRREAMLQALVRHPGAIKILDMDETTDGVVFIIMEFCPGRSLSRVIDTEAPLEVPRALSIATQILDILTTAHDAQIVHSDLKPENIMVETLADGSERARILDFGVAMLLADHGDVRADRRREAYHWGSPFYTSPEQALGRQIDARADLYSTGVLVFEMLTGRLPIQDDDLDRFYDFLVNRPADPVSKYRDDIPGHVQLAVRRALAKLPEDRPASASEMKAILIGERPTSRMGRIAAFGLAILVTFVFGILAGRASLASLPVDAVENARATSHSTHPAWLDAEAHLRRGRKLEASGDRAGAMTCYVQAMRDYERAIAYQPRHENAAADALARSEGLEGDPLRNAARDLHLMANRARVDGDYDLAIERYRVIVALVDLATGARADAVAARALAEPGHPSARRGEALLGLADQAASLPGVTAEGVESLGAAYVTAREAFEEAAR